MSIKVRSVGRDSPYIIFPLNVGLYDIESGYRYHDVNIVVFDTAHQSQSQRLYSQEYMKMLGNNLPKSVFKTGKVKSIVGDRACIHQGLSADGVAFPSNWRISVSETTPAFPDEILAYDEGVYFLPEFFGEKPLYTIEVPCGLDKNGETRFATLASDVILVVAINSNAPGQFVFTTPGKLSSFDWDTESYSVLKSQMKFTIKWGDNDISLITEGIGITAYGANQHYDCVARYALPDIRTCENIDVLKRLVAKGRSARLTLEGLQRIGPSSYQDENTGEVTPSMVDERVTRLPTPENIFKSSIEGGDIGVTTSTYDGKGFPVESRYFDLFSKTNSGQFWPTLDNKWSSNMPWVEEDIRLDPLAVSFRARCPSSAMADEDEYDFQDWGSDVTRPALAELSSHLVPVDEMYQDCWIRQTPATQQITNHVLEQTLENLKMTTVNIPVFIMQDMPELAEMLKRIGKLCDDPSTAWFKLVRFYKAKPREKLNLLRNNALIGPFIRRHMPTLFKNYADLWLSGRYGVRLTVADIKQMRDDYVKHRKRAKIKRGKRTFLASRAMDHIPWRGRSVDFHMKMYFDDNKDLSWASSFMSMYRTNFYFSALNTWDYIPFSFVVDWIIPVSKWLNTLDLKVANYSLPIVSVLYSLKCQDQDYRGSVLVQQLLVTASSKAYMRWIESKPRDLLFLPREILTLDKQWLLHSADATALVLQRNKRRV